MSLCSLKHCVPLQCGYGGVVSLCSLKHYLNKYINKTAVFVYSVCSDAETAAPCMPSEVAIVKKRTTSF